eukprot:49963_1
MSAEQEGLNQHVQPPNDTPVVTLPAISVPSHNYAPVYPQLSPRHCSTTKPSLPAVITSQPTAKCVSPCSHNKSESSRHCDCESQQRPTKPISSAYPGASSTTKGAAPIQSKTEPKACVCCIVAVICCCIIVGIVGPMLQRDHLDLLECFESPLDAGLPLSGEEFEFCQNGILQKILLSPKAKYFKPEKTLRCVMEIDDDGGLDSNASYIEISDDYPGTIDVDDVLLATADIFEDMHRNCTRFPAVVITAISHDNDDIITLQIREAEMFEYIDEMDVNIANASTYDSGIDMGEIKRLKNMVEYLNNRSAEEAADSEFNANRSAFQNVNYTEMESECYKVNDVIWFFDTLHMIFDQSNNDYSNVFYMNNNVFKTRTLSLIFHYYNIK